MTVQVWQVREPGCCTHLQPYWIVATNSAQDLAVLGVGERQGRCKNFSQRDQEAGPRAVRCSAYQERVFRDFQDYGGHGGERGELPSSSRVSFCTGYTVNCTYNTTLS